MRAVNGRMVAGTVNGPAAAGDIVRLKDVRSGIYRIKGWTKSAGTTRSNMALYVGTTKVGGLGSESEMVPFEVQFACADGLDIYVAALAAESSVNYSASFSIERIGDAGDR